MKRKIIEILTEHETTLFSGHQRSDDVCGISDNDYSDIADEIEKLFSLPDVSKQRELLIAYNKYMLEEIGAEQSKNIESMVNGFLSNL